MRIGHGIRVRSPAQNVVRLFVENDSGHVRDATLETLCVQRDAKVQQANVVLRAEDSVRITYTRDQNSIVKKATTSEYRGRAC